MQARSFVTTSAVVSAIVCATYTVSAGIDVKTSAEKTFDFKTVRTWGWASGEFGKVIMSRTQEDKPEAARARAEPIIMDAVKTEMSKRGLTSATSPDVAMMYYLLLSTNTSSQSVPGSPHENTSSKSDGRSAASTMVSVCGSSV